MGKSMQSFISNPKVGGGCGPRRIFKEPDRIVWTPEQIAEDKRQWVAYLIEQEVAALAEAEAKRAEAEATRNWFDAVRRFRSAGPTGEVGPLDDESAVIFVERFTEGKPMAAYVLFRTTDVFEPTMPLWYIGSKKRHGLKGFFVRHSRDQILATDEHLFREGGIVLLKGKVRPIGRAQSGKSLHVELVEGFQLNG